MFDRHPLTGGRVVNTKSVCLFIAEKADISFFTKTARKN